MKMSHLNFDRMCLLRSEAVAPHGILLARIMPERASFVKPDQ